MAARRGASEPIAWSVWNKTGPVSPMQRMLEEVSPGPVACCYEAGPCGYALQRQLDGNTRSDGLTPESRRGQNGGMKALSVRQPWADLIAAGRKTIETHTWSTHYRGDLLITSEKRALAVVTLTDCRPMIEDDAEAAMCEPYERAQAFVLENVRPVAPIEVRGRLGIYDAPVEIDNLEYLPVSRVSVPRFSST